MNKNIKNYDNDSIELIELLAVLFNNKKIILYTTLIFSLFGIVYSLSLPNIFKATSVFYPHIEKVNTSQDLKSLAGLAGIDINNEISDNIPPTLYPNLISSPKFKIEILNDTIIYYNDNITYREYLKNNSSFNFSIKELILLPIKIIKNKFLKKGEIESNKYYGILELSEDEYNLHKILSENIKLNLNEEEGFIELNVEDENPYVASQIAKKSNEILQKSIIDFKLKNINDTYKFIKSQLEVSKRNFYILQDSLAKFKDNNKNIKSDLFLNKFSRIESEYLISKNIYNELAINKEKIAIDVQKNTPIFTIIKPVVIPNKKFSPNRTLIVIFFFLSGIIISSSYVLGKPIFLKIKKIIYS
tara:strand:+ start:250 stop:1326 length:1077 start_codon:yes stop_codon:yes gene_type:complete